MKRTQSRVSLAVLVMVELAAGAGLVRLRSARWIAPPQEILRADPESALSGVVWVVAAAITAWLLLSTVAATVVYATGARRAIRTIEWLTLPPIRALARRATALSLVTASLAGPSAAIASEPPPIPVVVVTQAGSQTIESPTIELPPPAVPVVSTQAATTTPLGLPAPIPDFVWAPPPSTSQVEAAQDPEPARYVVRPGDNMWTITAAYLTDRQGEPPSNPEISRVWRLVMDLNESRIRSGDVDLIFPGEELLLPPLPIGG